MIWVQLSYSGVCTGKPLLGFWMQSIHGIHQDRMFIKIA